MPFESLLKLAETLKERVSVHNTALSASETLTRYALIDPLLRELGWDTSDPSAVVPEYKTQQGGKADYALLSADKPAMIVEAKKLGTPLRDKALEQSIGYCLMDGTPHFAVTDGARWEIYATHSPVPIDQKRIIEFDLSADPPATVCLKALALWRPSVESGSVAAARPSVIEEERPVVIPPPPPPPTGDWRPLTDPDVKKSDSRKPAEMLFPDGSRTELRNWVELSLETVRWLSTNGHLTRGNCPIKSGRSRHIVHTSPNHSDGKAFRRARDANGFYIEANASRNRHIDNSVLVIERVGQNPSQFRVRFAD